MRRNPADMGREGNSEEEETVCCVVFGSRGECGDCS